jgi:hypothetical protein
MACVIFSLNCTFISLLFHIVPAITKKFITSLNRRSYSLLRSVPCPVLSAPCSQLFPHRDHPQHFGAPILCCSYGGGWHSPCHTLPPTAVCNLILWPTIAVIWFKCFVHVTTLILGAFVKLRKVTDGFVISVCPSVRMEQFESHRTNFHEILYFENFSKTSPESSSSIKL